MIVVIASQNPVKQQAAAQGFTQMFPTAALDVRCLTVDPGVPDQPFGDAQTRAGSQRRAQAAMLAAPQADFWVGIEGGVAPDDAANGKAGGEPALLAFAWVTVLSRSSCGQARSASFALPPRVAQLVHSGLELGQADDIVFGQQNSKQAGGAVGLLTGNVLDRAGLYAQAVLLALIPFRNEGLYEPC